MNKEAVYDSLIDASKVVQEEGADLKGSLKSGSFTGTNYRCYI